MGKNGENVKCEIFDLDLSHIVKIDSLNMIGLEEWYCWDYWLIIGKLLMFMIMRYYWETKQWIVITNWLNYEQWWNVITFGIELRECFDLLQFWQQLRGRLWVMKIEFLC